MAVFVCFVVDGFMSSVELLVENVLKELLHGVQNVEVEFDDGIFVLVGDV